METAAAELSPSDRHALGQLDRTDARGRPRPVPRGLSGEMKNTFEAVPRLSSLPSVGDPVNGLIISAGRSSAG